MVMVMIAIRMIVMRSVRVCVPAAGHRIFKILWAVRMIVCVVNTPLVENWVSFRQTRRRTQFVLVRRTPGIVVKVIK